KFKKQDVVRTLCQEESQYGWELVEKFDNNRIRFKRKTNLRTKDQFSQTDPYRTTYGMSEGGLALTIIATIFGLVGLTIYIVYLFRING
ncbi:MAG: hypothetical protein ABIJ45_05425, partial [Candidatus Zixiibacteriota bacterium]